MNCPRSHCPRRRLWLFFGLCVLFFCCIMSCVPLVSDDIEYASLEHSGLADQVSYVLHYGNGRFLGNLGAVCLVKMPALSVFVKAILLSGVIFLVPALLDIRDFTGYALSFLLFISIRQTLFGQVYSWTSGFHNYIPPVFLTLLILFLIKSYDRLDSPAKKALLLPVIFLLGVAGQLYIEHCALMNGILSGCLLCMRRRKGRCAAPAAVWFCAALIGLLLLFAIPIVFYTEGNRSEGYRSVNLSGLFSFLKTAVITFAKVGCTFPPLSVIIVSALTAATTYFTRTSRRVKWNTLIYYACGCVVLFFVLNEILLDNAWNIRHQTIGKLITACMAFLPLLLWPAVLIPLDHKPTRNRICFLISAGICSLLPFLIISPAPSRVLFFAYVCTVGCILTFYQYLCGRIGTSLVEWIQRAVPLTAAVMSLFLLFTFRNISWISGLRETHIRQEMEKGKTEIIIFEDPYAYVHFSGVGCYNRCFYYEEPYDITFIGIDFDTWYKYIWLSENSE